MFPKLIDTGGFFLPTYGVLVATAFLVGIWMTGRLARRVGVNPDHATDLAIACAVAGMVGAKLMMFAFDWQYYSLNWRELFSVSTLLAAGVYQGGFALAVLTAIWFIRKHKMPGLLTFDVFAPGIALGHAIGRLGCFAAGCCWGQECHLPWAVTFHSQAANELTGVPLNIPLHPTQLYESALEIGIFLYLLWYFNRPHRTGTVIAWYLILYSVARFGVEFLRHHDQPLQFGLSLTQWISLATFFAGLVVMMRGSATVEPSRAAA